MPNLVDLAESFDLFESATGRVDRERGVIKNAKLLGWKSQNGREYDPAGVDPKLYEGRPVNINHAKGERSAYDRFGRTVNVVKRSNGLYGDLEYLKSHPLAAAVTEAAERMPGVFGLSHTARGREKYGSHGAVIEAVESVQSVDLVGDPATVAGLYESRGYKPMKLTLKEICEQLKPTRPKYVAKLEEMAEAGLLSPSATMEAPPAEAAPEAVDHVQALRDAAKAVLDDTTLSIKEICTKIKDILKIIGGDQGGSEPPPDFGGEEGEESSDAENSDEGDDEKKDKEESKKAKKGNNSITELLQLKAEKLIRQAADKAGVKLSEKLIEAVARPNLTEAQAATIVAELKPAATHSGQRVRSASPTQLKGKAGATVTESKNGDAVPGDPAKLGAYLNGR